AGPRARSAEQSPGHGKGDQARPSRDAASDQERAEARAAGRAQPFACCQSECGARPRTAGGVMMKMKDLLRASSVLALVAVAAGCQETTGPSSLGKLNTAVALADYNAMDGVLQSSGWKSFQVTASAMDVAQFGFAPATAAGVTAVLRTLPNGGDTRAFAAAMAGVANASMDGTASIPLISTGNRGKTFVYNATLHNWEIDPARTGAPSNGVRF